MTTKVDDILNIEDIYETNEEEDNENLVNKIMNLSLPVQKRVSAMEQYYQKEDIGDNAVEVINTLAGMYQMSGSRVIEQFFYNLCVSSNISSFLKVETAKNLIGYEETLAFFDEQYKEENMNELEERNKKRKDLGYNALNQVCMDLTNTPTPCRTEAITTLMECKRFEKEADTYFCTLVNDQSIECDFRYKTILSLENKTAELLRYELNDIFDDTEFIKNCYEKLHKSISYLFPNYKPKPTDSRFWREVLRRLSYDDLRLVYKDKNIDVDCGLDKFLKNAQLAFLFNDSNYTYYKILSGQYILQKFSLPPSTSLSVQERILSFAQDTELDYDRRADAADVLLQLGNEDMQKEGRAIIIELGRVNGQVRTVFDNAQNVHSEKVEESVAEALEFLSTLPIHTVNKTPIDFDYVNTQIENMLKKKEEERKEKRTEYTDLPHQVQQEKSEKIRLAMNRIQMDRALYSKFNSSLLNILLKVWTYMVTDEENFEEMCRRLLEELEEMSHTCSSGYASRLINVISGFGNFNIRISFEDQIIANFNGRLNAKVRLIQADDSPFRKERLNDLVELWLNTVDNKELKKSIEIELNPSKDVETRPSMIDIVNKYLSTDKEKKVENCIGTFAELVFNEMTLKSSDYTSRQNFALFFRTYVGSIREELYEEFKEFLSDTDFDLYMRKALMSYEGEL